MKVLGQGASHHIAKRGPKGQPSGKNCNHASATLHGKEISDQSGRNGYVACLADSYHHMAEQKLAECMRIPCVKRESAPDEDSHGNNVPAGEAVAQVPNERRRT